MIKKIRHYFATGLLITLPVFFTLYIMYTALVFIDGVCGKVLNFYIKKHLGFTIPGVGIILGIVTVFLIGFVAANFLGKKFLHALESWFLKFPFIRQVYPAAKQIVDSFVSKEGPSFKKVVLVEYPSKGLWAVGFLTNDGFKEACLKTGAELVHVFVPHTPSPLTGFLVLVARQDIKILDIPVEDGIKLIISGGIVKP